LQLLSGIAIIRHVEDHVGKTAMSFSCIKSGPPRQKDDLGESGKGNAVDFSIFCMHARRALTKSSLLVNFVLDV
jgi:hypothetical protein